MSIMTEMTLDDDPVSGTKLVYHFDPVTEQASVVESQDVTGLLERNARLRAGPPTVSKSKEWELIASIPGNVLHRLKRLGIVTSMHEDPWQRKLLKWIKGHPKFKTSDRKVI